MKKIIFFTLLFATISLSTNNIYACVVNANSASCSVTDYYGTRSFDGVTFYITPYTDVYFNTTVTSYDYPGSAGLVAYTDGYGATPADYGSSGVEWTDGIYDTYGASSSHSNIHWYTGANGWVDIWLSADEGYAYVGVTW